MFRADRELSFLVLAVGPPSRGAGRGACSLPPCVPFVVTEQLRKQREEVEAPIVCACVVLLICSHWLSESEVQVAVRSLLKLLCGH